MAAIRIIDDHLELANIGSNTHAQIDTHIAAADNYVKRDGSLALTTDWDIGDTRKILGDEIRARDGAGLKLYDDAGNGIFVKDGGNVGIGTTAPGVKLDVNGQGLFTSDTFPILQTIRTSGISGGVLNVLDFIHQTHSNMVDGFGSRVTISIEDGTSGRRAIAAFDGVRDGGDDTGRLDFKVAAAGALETKMSIKNTGNVGIGTTIPTAKLDINSDIFRLRTAKTPATAGAAGNQGDICWDAGFIYVCTATNTWKRAAIAAW